MLLGGAKELKIVHISIIRGAKEPRNLQNHRGVIAHRYRILFQVHLAVGVQDLGVFAGTELFHTLLGSPFCL